MDNLSGVPPIVTLSGIPGVGSFSGAGQSDLSGTGNQSLLPGMQAGPDLLQMLLQQGGGDQGVSSAAGLGLGQSLAAPSFGQQPGLTAGNFSQQGAGGTGGAIAGQTAAGGSQGSVGSNIDPLAILQKILGLTRQGLGVAAGFQGSGGTGTGTASPTGSVSGSPGEVSGGGGTSDSSLTGIASPVLGNLGSNLSNIGGLSDTLRSGQQFGTPTLSLNLYPTELSPETVSWLQQAGVDPNAFAQAFGSNPAFAESLLSQGFSPTEMAQLAPGQGFEQASAGADTLSGASGLQGGSFGLGNAASGIGGLQSLLGLIQGGMAGTLNPVSVLQGLQGLYQGATGLLGASPLASYIATELPQLASALTSLAGTGGAAAGTAGATAGASAGATAAPAVSAALAGVSAAAAPIIAAITSYLSEADKRQMLRSGFVNNPIAGALYSNATAGIGRDLAALQALEQSGGISAAGTDQLAGLLPGLINNIGPYYATAQGPLGGIRASDAITGMFGRQGIGGAEEYTRNAQQAQKGVLDIINELMNRGMTYEQLGALPVSGNFVQQTMDMDPEYLKTFYNMNQGQYDTQAQGLLNTLYSQAQQTPVTAWNSTGEGGFEMPTGEMSYSYGGQPLPQGLTPMDLLTAAQGSAPYGPDKATNASGLVTSMFGGPLWAAIARMGNMDPGLTAQISQHFNPWATLSNFTGPQLFSALNPYVIQPMLQGPQGVQG